MLNLIKFFSLIFSLVILSGCAGGTDSTLATNQKIADLQKAKDSNIITDSEFKKSKKNLLRNEVIMIEDINQVLTKDEKFELEAVIEKIITFHKRHLAISSHLILPTRIFISKEKYKEYQNEISWTAKSNTGFYSVAKKELVIFKSKYYLKTIIHEAQHYVLGTEFSRPPAWINEGLSEFFEEGYLKNNQLFVRAQSKKRKLLKKWLKKGKLPDLSTFVNLTHQEWNKDPKVSYTVSWGLIYFLMNSEDGRSTLSSTIEALKHSKYRDCNSVLDSNYKGGMDALSKDFDLFINNMPRKQKI